VVSKPADKSINYFNIVILTMGTGIPTLKIYEKTKIKTQEAQNFKQNQRIRMFFSPEI